MLTALNIEEFDRGGLRGLLSSLRRNRIRVEHLYCDTASLKSVTYERRRGSVNWASIDRFVKGQRGRVLCPEGLELPPRSGYRRFVSRELSRRMCENAAVYLLGECPGARVALIDDCAESLPLCSYLIAYTDSLRVVTRAMRAYLQEADRILDESGAAVRVSSSYENLDDAQIIIAPRSIGRDLSCSRGAVILSGEAPAVLQNAPVIYDYTFDLPDKYRGIKPPYLDDMYFASALYKMSGAHELGSFVFSRCTDGITLHTRASLVQLL